MVKRKGLFHIFEVVIISIVMFMIIFQLSFTPRAQSDWGKSRLTVLGRDILFTMNEAGVNWSDEGPWDTNPASDFLEKSLNPFQIKYRLELIGAPVRTIRVGCFCPTPFAPCTNFCTWLHNSLDLGLPELTFNGLKTNFSVHAIYNISHYYDVIVTNHELIPEVLHEVSLANFILDDKGFVFVRDLGDTDFNDYGDTLRDYFAIEEATSGETGTVVFDTSDMVGKPDYYLIQKYFTHIENDTGDFLGLDHEFDAQFANGDKASVLPDGVRILRYQGLSGNAACVAKHGALQNIGRTAWLSEDPSAPSYDNNDWEIMLTSLIIWASEHRRLVADNALQNERTSVSMFVIPANHTTTDYNHMFHPMEARLTLGYVYS